MTKKEEKIEKEMPEKEVSGKEAEEKREEEILSEAAEEGCEAEATEEEKEEKNVEKTVEEALIEENEALKNEVEQIKEELAEKDDRHLRLQAEFDNFRRRTIKEKDDLRQNATADLLSDLLPVLDNFDRALVHAEESPILEGIVMVQKQMLDILERAGLKKAGEVGESFDPKFHDAIMQEEKDGVESGIILEVLQPGYKLHDKLLRAAMVKVSQ